MALSDKDTGTSAARDVYFINITTASSASTYREVLLESVEDPFQSRLSGVLLSKISKLLHKDMPDAFFIRKFTDASIGGNDVINPHFQFGVDDDLVHPLYAQDRITVEKHKGPVKYTPHNDKAGSVIDDGKREIIRETLPGYEGAGRVWAEMYNTNQQVLWLRMGVPKYIGLVDYYKQDGDISGYSEFVNNGHSKNFVYTLGKLLSDTAYIAFKLPFYPFIWGYKAASGVYNFALNPDESKMYNVVNNNIMRDISASKYCYLKPTPFHYYRSVNTILINLAVNMGLVGATNVTGAEIINSETAYKEAGLNGDDIPQVLEHGPDIFSILDRRYVRLGPTAGGGTDGYTDATMATKFNDSVKALRDKEKVLDGMKAAAAASVTTASKADVQAASSGTPSIAGANFRVKSDAEAALGKQKLTDFVSELTDSFMHHSTGALDFVGFRIDKNADNSESVSSSIGPSQLSQKINGAAESSREAAFTLQKLKTGVTVVDAVTGLGQDAISAITNAVGGGQGVELIAGNGYFEIPEIWKNSTFTKNYTFNIQLKSLYGDPVSVFQSIYIPLAMLISMAFPRAISKNMYTSPFCVEAYSRGMIAIPMGMIESMTIRRGLPEYGWTNTGLPTSVEVSMTIKDLSPVMFTGMSDSSFSSILSQNDAFHGYLTTLSGLGLRERLDDWKLLNRKFTIWAQMMKLSWGNPYFLGAMTGQGTMPKLLFRFIGPWATLPKQ